MVRPQLEYASTVWDLRTPYVTNVQQSENPQHSTFLMSIVGLVQFYQCRVFHLFQSYLSNGYIKVVTPFDSSDLHPVSAGVPQGAIWLPLLFNLYIHCC